MVRFTAVGGRCDIITRLLAIGLPTQPSSSSSSSSPSSSSLLSMPPVLGSEGASVSAPGASLSSSLVRPMPSVAHAVAAALALFVFYHEPLPDALTSAEFFIAAVPPSDHDGSHQPEEEEERKDSEDDQEGDETRSGGKRKTRDQDGDGANANGHPKRSRRRISSHSVPTYRIFSHRLHGTTLCFRSEAGGGGGERGGGRRRGRGGGGWGGGGGAIRNDLASEVISHVARCHSGGPFRCSSAGTLGGGHCTLLMPSSQVQFLPTHCPPQPTLPPTHPPPHTSICCRSVTWFVLALRT